MIDLCRQNAWTLISRDGIKHDGSLAVGGVVHRAKTAGVEVTTPEEYAQAVLTRDAARAMFNERLLAAVSHYLATGPVDEQAQREVNALHIKDGFAAIWSINSSAECDTAHNP
jgi:hypothetical protein